MDLTIRPANLKDLPVLVKMGRELILYLNREEKKRRKTNLMAIDHQVAEKGWRKYYRQNLKSRKSLFLLALKGENVVGMALGRIEKAPPVFKTKRFGEIHELFVKKPYRQQKIGTALVETLESFFRQKKISLIQIKAESFNAEALTAYRKLGYQDSRKILHKEL